MNMNKYLSLNSWKCNRLTSNDDHKTSILISDCKHSARNSGPKQFWLITDWDTEFRHWNVRSCWGLRADNMTKIFPYHNTYQPAGLAPNNVHSNSLPNSWKWLWARHSAIKGQRTGADPGICERGRRSLPFPSPYTYNNNNNNNKHICKAP